MMKQSLGGSKEPVNAACYSESPNLSFYITISIFVGGSLHEWCNVSRQTGIDTQRLPDGTAAPARIGFEMKRYMSGVRPGPLRWY